MKKSESFVNSFYNLCDPCSRRNNMLERLVDKNQLINDLDTNMDDNVPRDCFICRGLFHLIDEIVNEIMLLVLVKNKYEFDSYLLGTSLPAILFDNEDHFRSIFQIRGEQNIKSAFNTELRNKIEKVLKKPLKANSPDLKINLLISADLEFSINLQCRPYYLICRYTKRKFMNQRHIRCYNCERRLCNQCDHINNSHQQRSIEMIVQKYLIGFTLCENVKFTWMGSEDQNSMVLGKGRFFIAHIINPKKRKIRKNTIFKEEGIIVKIKEKKESIQKFTINYISKTKAYVKTMFPIDNLYLKRLNKLKNYAIKYRNKTKILERKIYKISVKKLDEYSFVLTVLADGGLFIKQFIEGKNWIGPNVSSHICNKCTCIKFDILDIIA